MKPLDDFVVGFNEALAHLIEAGADIFLMPSRFEPCGLNQMYSLRYGAVPVVRGVGGLNDTVRDYVPGDPKSTGFVFHEYSGDALLGALRRALALYGEPLPWRALQAAGITVLENEAAVLDRGTDRVYLVGLADTWTRSVDFVKAFGSEESERNRVRDLARHRPDVNIET